MESLLIITIIALICGLGYFINSEILTLEEVSQVNEKEYDIVDLVERRIRRK